MDSAIVVWLATHRVDILNDPMVWLGTIEKLGAVWVALAVVVGMIRGLGVARSLGLAVVVALATFAADALAFLIKDLTHRTRPFVAHPQIHPLYVVHSSSFPAGHAATAFAGAVLLSVAAPRFAPAFVALAVLIGVSRVYDGVHYPSDVLVGALLGALVGGAVVGLLRIAPTQLAGPQARAA
jgi:undecaprenyl-diphosphatase